MDAKYLAEIKARVEKDIPGIAAPVFRDRKALLAEVEQANDACETACAVAREYCDKLVIAEKQIATLKKALELACERIERNETSCGISVQSSKKETLINALLQQAQEQGGDLPDGRIAPENASEVVKNLWELYDKYEDVEHVVCGDAATLLTAAPENKPDWIPVSKRLPKQNGYYLGCEYSSHPITVRYLQNEFYDADGDAVNITHWMPLPDAPDARKPEGSA